MSNGEIEVIVRQRETRALFPAERGYLHISGTRFYTEGNELWQWRGYSDFLLYYDFVRGVDIRPNLRKLREFGFNLVRVFGPLDWPQLENYTHRDFNTERIEEFNSVVASEGMRVEWSVICYPYDINEQRRILQAVYDAALWNVLVEVSNEPERPINGQNKCDPVEVLRGIDRRGVLTSYGLYPTHHELLQSKPILDFMTIHNHRDSSWARRSRVNQEGQSITGKPWIGDEPVRAEETDTGGQTTASPAEYAHYGGIAMMYTPGFTYHCNEGKFGRIPTPGMVQYRIMEELRDTLFEKVGPVWQLGRYASPDSSSSPVNWTPGIWTYSSILTASTKQYAFSVRVDDEPSVAVKGWREVERWGPNGTFMFLEKP